MPVTPVSYWGYKIQIACLAAESPDVFFGFYSE